MATATIFLASGLSLVGAAPASANASNAGSARPEVEVRLAIDSNRTFVVAGNTRRVSSNLNITLDSQSAATFSNQTFTIGLQLKNPSGEVITSAIASALSPTANFYNNINWSASGGLTGFTANTPVTIGSNNTSLNANVGVSLETNDGTYLPTGNYQYELTFLKGGSAYTFANNDTITSYAYATLAGTSFTIPSNVESNSVPRLSVATCVNRSLVTSSDTLTVNPVVTSSGTAPTISTRFFQGTSLGQATLLSNTSTLALTSVDLTKPISVGLSAELVSTANVTYSADLSVTRGDGTEVTQSCTPATPSAPTVSVISSTVLRATFNVSTPISYANCFLYLASDPNTFVRRSGGMPNNSVATCNFSGVTANVEYVVKVQEFFDYYYSEYSQQQQQQSIPFNIYRPYPSALSQASSVISSAGVQNNNNQNSQTPEQIAAAAAAQAAALLAAAIVKAKTTLHGTLQGDKPGTLDQYRAADYKVNNDKVVTKVNAAVLKLPLADRENVEKIAAIIKVENFVDLVSTPATQKRVTSKALVELGLVAVDNPNKTTIANALKKADAASLNSIEKIQEAIKAELAAVKERKDLLAEIKARIAARKK